MCAQINCGNNNTDALAAKKYLFTIFHKLCVTQTCCWKQLESDPCTARIRCVSLWLWLSDNRVTGNYRHINAVIKDTCVQRIRDADKPHAYVGARAHTQNKYSGRHSFLVTNSLPLLSASMFLNINCLIRYV